VRPLQATMKKAPFAGIFTTNFRLSQLIYLLIISEVERSWAKKEMPFKSNFGQG
jgi:hypothetical protein